MKRFISKGLMGGIFGAVLTISGIHTSDWKFWVLLLLFALNSWESK